MSDLFGNKIAFCVLGTGLMVIGLNEASHAFFHTAHHDKPGYIVEVPEEAAGPAEAVVEEGPRDYGVLVAAGDIEAGKAVAVKCVQCHSFEAGGPTIQGPSLYGVMGRPIASVAGFKYSSGGKGLSDIKANWDYDHIDRFVENPKKYASGTAMSFIGVKKQKDRSDLMAYLRTLTAGEPLALPAALPAAAPADPAAAPADGVIPADTSAPAAGEAGTPAPGSPGAVPGGVMPPPAQAPAPKPTAPPAPAAPH